jgi:acyl carrier protein
MRNKIHEIIQSIRPEIIFKENEDSELFGIIDSLDIIIIVEEIESFYNIFIQAEEIIPENFSSVSILEEFIKRKINGHAI